MSFLSALKSFDAYPKLNEEFRVKTFGGAIISLLSVSLIALLLWSELSLYLQVDTVNTLYVDVSRGEKMKINFDVTFPRIPCSMLSVDAMDVSGSHQLDVSAHLRKLPLDRFGQPTGGEQPHQIGGVLKEEHVKQYAQAVQRNGTQGEASAPPAAAPVPPPPPPKVDPTKQPGYCGSCYGCEQRPGQCCNTCDEVRDCYRARGWALNSLNNIEQCVATGQTQERLLAELERGDGCRMYGFLEVNKVAGNVHFAPGKSFQHAHMHIHDLASFPASRFNVSHEIHHFSFGEPFPGAVNPLDDTKRQLGPEDGGGMFMYYVKVVPTKYTALNGTQLRTNQYSVTEHFRTVGAREGQGLPGAFIFYELSPIMVEFTERHQSLGHFLTQLCAILGGVFTCAGMVDRIVYSSLRHMRKKNQQGKLS